MFNEKYKPVKALVVFTSNIYDAPPYIESYDIDEKGYPINAHPLTINETEQLRKSLIIQEEKERRSYLISESILPEKVLHIDYINGQVVWFTGAQKKSLQFTKSIGLNDGEANVPAMIWKASKGKLSVWALSTRRNKRPNVKDQLYKAPFFNIYDNGSVCMGSVGTFPVKSNRGLEYFMEYWEAAFWNSSFSHLNVDKSPVKGNIVQLWKELLNTDTPFPTECLITTEKNINKII